MDDRLILKAIKTILVIHEVHVNDDEGDKFLSDPNLAIQAIDQVACGYFGQAVKDGFLTQEIVNNAIQAMEACAHCNGPISYTTGKWSKNGKTYCCPACQMADQEVVEMDAVSAYPKCEECGSLLAYSHCEGCSKG